MAVFSTRSGASGAAGSAAAASASAEPVASASAAPAPSAYRPNWDTEEIPSYKVGFPLRPMDMDIIAALRGGNIDRTNILDVFHDRPYRVRFAGDITTQQFRFVLVDLNRTGTWDEKWDLSEPGQIKRTVMHDPGALNHVEVMYTLTHGRWQAH
jgi:hypothetical protein